MADTVQFDLVSPERNIVSVQATAVQIPGADGDMTAMPGHVQVITTLRPGIVTVSAAGGDKEYVVLGGFAEISDTSVAILAERAFARADIQKSDFDLMLSQAKEKATGDNADNAKALADIEALGAYLKM